jgi:hypothetical protein
MAKLNVFKRSLANKEIKVAFDDTTMELGIDQIIPIKAVADATKKSAKYKQILASIKEVGIIEPLVVSNKRQSKGKYILLDGHMRLEALKERGETSVVCLVSTDDESFTYNKHISRLSTVQEHKMIVRAVERGVSEEKIAHALNVDVDHIIRKKTLLVGICDEAIEMLKDKMTPVATFPVLRRMKPMRQIEAVSLMIDANVYSRSYADALLAATPKDQLVEPDKPKRIKGLDEDQMARMESEMESLQREYKLIEDSYSKDVLNITLAKSYLTNLLSNAKVVRYLAQNHPEILTQFQKITEMTALKAA